MTSFLPIPSIREFWAAKGGGLFFLKWMIFCGAQMILSFLPFRMLTGTSWQSGIYPNIYWVLPPFLPGFALFGLHWRTFVWGMVTVAADTVSSSFWPDLPFPPFELPHKLLIFILLPVSLTLIPHTLLFVNPACRIPSRAGHH